MPVHARTPFEMFQSQIDCIIKDDRGTQIQLYSEDCIYEVPFATEPPRFITGRDGIRRVMAPLWAEARRVGARVIGMRDAVVHTTADPEVIVVEFTRSVDVKGSVSPLALVQVLRVPDGHVCHMREYFSPVARSQAVEQLTPSITIRRARLRTNVAGAPVEVAQGAGEGISRLGATVRSASIGRAAGVMVVVDRERGHTAGWRPRRSEGPVEGRSGRLKLPGALQG